MEFNKPETLNITVGDAAENFIRFKEEILTYFAAIENEKKPIKVQVARLKNLLGSDALRMYKNLVKEDDDETIVSILKKLEEFLVPKKNETMAIFKFFSRKQFSNESFDTFYLELKNLITPCQFLDQENKILRSQIVVGINSRSVQERLLREDLPLDKVVNYCKSIEIANENIKQIQGEKVAGIDDVRFDSDRTKTLTKSFGKQNRFMFKSNENSNSNSCFRCGYQHKNKVCPALNKQCAKCKKLNHFANVCRSRNLPQSFEVENKIVQSESQDTEETNWVLNEEISTISVDRIKANHWTVDLHIGSSVVTCKIDTGADVNILSMKILKALGHSTVKQLRNTNIQLEAFCGFKIDSVGEIELPVKLTGSKNLYYVKFIVVSNSKATPILGLSSSIELKLITRQSYIEVLQPSVPDLPTLIKQNQDVFLNQGCFPDILKLKLANGATPVSCPARRIPHTLCEKLKNKLQLLEKCGIIEQCEAGEWVNNLVIVEKHKTGDIRICLDPKELNKYLIRDYVLIPKFDEIIEKLADKKYFCVFDLKDGFHQIKLDNESSNLCMFSTPFGVFRYLRAPFGLSVLPEYFQRSTSRIFGAIDGVTVYFDDILCAAKSKDELYKVVQKVIEAARFNHVQFNENKVQYFVQSVKFIGHVFDSHGVRPDEDRIKAIDELKCPTNRTELQRILGTVNYLRPFIPHLAEICSPFHSLLKKNTLWQWTSRNTEQFNQLKKAIRNAALLTPFDPQKPITIQADASKMSLGCALFQNGQPIMYASRSLSNSEISYAQIEKEMLSISYAFQKFHYFVYGHKNIEVHTDHSPLLSIVSKGIPQITNNRLRRLRLKLLNYQFSLKFVPGKHLHVADLLSRDCEPTPVVEDDSMMDIIHVLGAIKINPNTVNEYIKATKDDDTLFEVKKFYNEGWPKSFSSENSELNHYFGLRNDITVQDDLVYLDDKLIVPKSMRKSTLQTLHETHLGFNKLKIKAQEYFYWPGLVSDLRNITMSCATCAKFRRSKLKEPLLSHEIIDLPFYKVAADILEFDGNNYLVLVDYYSRWLEVERIRDKSALSVINVLKGIFARFGIPSIFVSDNIPFNSKQFLEFSKLWNFELKFSSPLYPRSNGLAEKGVGIAKIMLKKAKLEKTDISLYLLNYRSAPVANLVYSPAQLLQSRMIKTKLPTLPTKLTPHVIQDKAVTSKIGQAAQYNKTALNKPHVFTEGQNVLVRNAKTKVWEEGVIYKDLGNRSYLVTLNGVNYRRNSWFMKPNCIDGKRGVFS